MLLHSVLTMADVEQCCDVYHSWGHINPLSHFCLLWSRVMVYLGEDNGKGNKKNACTEWRDEISLYDICEWFCEQIRLRGYVIASAHARNHHVRHNRLRSIAVAIEDSLHYVVLLECVERSRNVRWRFLLHSLRLFEMGIHSYTGKQDRQPLIFTLSSKQLHASSQHLHLMTWLDSLSRCCHTPSIRHDLWFNTRLFSHNMLAQLTSSIGLKIFRAFLLLSDPFDLHIAYFRRHIVQSPLKRIEKKRGWNLRHPSKRVLDWTTAWDLKNFQLGQPSQVKSKLADPS